MDNVVRMKQSVTNMHLISVKCFLVCREEPSYLSTLLTCKGTFREKQLLFWGNWCRVFLIKMITNSISCVYCVDLSDIIYIVDIVCIFTSVFLFSEVFSACGWVVRSAHNNEWNNTPNANMAVHESGVSQSLMFCFDNAFTDNSCFVVDVFCFILLSLRVVMFLNATRMGRNLPPVISKGMWINGSF